MNKERYYSTSGQKQNTKIKCTSKLQLINIGIVTPLLKNAFVIPYLAIVILVTAYVKIILTKNFWESSGLYLQAQWEKMVDMIGDNPYSYWVYVEMLVFVATYWILGGVYTFFDFTNKPIVLRKYKTQPGTNEPVEIRRLFKVLLLVSVNQLLTFPLLVFAYHIMQWRGYQQIRELPTLHVLVLELLINILLEEIGFYYVHRILHHRLFYKLIHKKHHEWTSPIAITAIYAHPIEHLLSNILPIFMGTFILGSHVITSYIWSIIAIAATLHSHSGYHLPFLPSPEFHDYHHLKFTENYGVLGLLDWIHGTDVKFRRSTIYKRHAFLLSLKSAREMYPNENEKD